MHGNMKEHSNWTNVCAADSETTKLQPNSAIPVYRLKGHKLSMTWISGLFYPPPLLTVFRQYIMTALLGLFCAFPIAVILNVWPLTQLRCPNLVFHPCKLLKSFNRKRAAVPFSQVMMVLSLQNNFNCAELCSFLPLLPICVGCFITVSRVLAHQLRLPLNDIFLRLLDRFQLPS